MDKDFLLMLCEIGLMAASSRNTQGTSGSPKGTAGTVCFFGCKYDVFGQFVTGASVALPADFFTHQRSGLRLEGLKTTPWVLKREHLCDQICKIVDREKILLVRAPFASGKTSLAQLLHYFLSQDKKNVHVVTLAEADVSWSECFLHQTGLQWSDITHTGPVYVIIDEVQISYPQDSSTNGLWKSIKGLGKRRGRGE